MILQSELSVLCGKFQRNSSAELPSPAETLRPPEPEPRPPQEREPGRPEDKTRKRRGGAEDLPAATKAQPFPSSHFRKSSTRDRLTTISNSGRGRAVIFSRLPRYFTMLTIAGMAMMQLRDMRKNRPGSSSSERTSSD